MRSRATLAALGAVAIIALLVVLLRPPVGEPGAPTSVDPGSGLRIVSLASLPVEARDTVRLIDRGGPFPYAQDGGVFGNRERLLPAQPNGFYREYTVRSPREADRGPLRLVAGNGGAQLFYTADHYASFVRVAR